MKPRIFSVVTNQTQYNTLVRQNPFLKNCICQFATNTPACNISVATHYNRFIDQEILPEKQDGWVIFCHQDFEWLEDPAVKLSLLNPQHIYGPVGMQQIPVFVNILHSSFSGSRCYCQIPAGRFIIGHPSTRPEPVDTLDCCCVCIHSSLLKKHRLRFDDIFDFHQYVEDFCLSAQNKQIAVYAVQFSCAHHSIGRLDKLFFKRYSQLCKKHTHCLFVTPLVPIQWRIGNRRGYLPSYHTRWIFITLFNKIILPVRSFIYRLSHRKT